MKKEDLPEPDFKRSSGLILGLVEVSLALNRPAEAQEAIRGALVAASRSGMLLALKSEGVI